MGLRETKPINFGSQKAEGRETHKFWESQSREKRNQYSAWVWRGMGRDIWVEILRETHILLGHVGLNP